MRTLDDAIRARETEQARLTTFLRQRETLTRTPSSPTWRAAQLADLDVCIATSRALIAEHGDTILNTWQTTHPEPSNG